jgi:N-acetylglucosamine-6-phosphate deacetylase
VTGSLRVRGGVDLRGRPCEVLVVDGRVSGDEVADVLVLDAQGAVVAPGLVDLQVNGAAGVDITATPERMGEVAAALPAHGVTAFLPTVITAPPDRVGRAITALQALHAAKGVGARPLGLHLEGPMLAPSRRGAHPEQWLRAPSLDLVAGWSRDAGVAMVTLAPELSGALDVVHELVARGVVVSVGHTDGSAAEVVAALDAGATCMTHLFNAMRPLGHREPGPVGVTLSGHEVVAGLIADGHHVDSLVLEVVWRALGPERFLTVSDTTAALGLPDGPTVLGDQQVFVAQGTVRLPDGTLAGSAASLLDGVRGLLRATGCSLADAVATVTTTPARVLGDPSLGRLEPGCVGDLVLLDHDAATGSLDVVATVVDGTLVHSTRGSR